MRSYLPPATTLDFRPVPGLSSVQQLVAPARSHNMLIQRLSRHLRGNKTIGPENNVGTFVKIRESSDGNVMLGQASKRHRQADRHRGMGLRGSCSRAYRDFVQSLPHEGDQLRLRRSRDWFYRSIGRTPNGGVKVFASMGHDDETRPFHCLCVIYLVIVYVLTKCAPSRHYHWHLARLNSLEHCPYPSMQNQ